MDRGRWTAIQMRLFTRAPNGGTVREPLEVQKARVLEEVRVVCKADEGPLPVVGEQAHDQALQHRKKEEDDYKEQGREDEDERFFFQDRTPPRKEARAPS